MAKLYCKFCGKEITRIGNGFAHQDGSEQCEDRKRNYDRRAVPDFRRMSYPEFEKLTQENRL